MLRVESCQKGRSLSSEGGGMVGGGEVCLAKGQIGKQLESGEFMQKGKAGWCLGWRGAKKGNL